VERGGCVYIMTNDRRTVLYVGVTSDLHARVVEHKEKVYPQSFTSKYNAFNLIYYETFFSIEEAIDREKQIKKYSHLKKVKLIIAKNPAWKDLFDVVKYW
jgi:putative endonuclease